MKTTEDLNALIPTITAKFLAEFKTGDLSNGSNKSGVCYEEDGWVIDVDMDIDASFSYDEMGFDVIPWSVELESLSYSVTKVSAYHYDYDTDEETEFTEEECGELLAAFDNILD